MRVMKVTIVAFFLYNLSIFFCNVAAFIFCMNHQGYAYSLKQNYEFAKYRIICTRSKKQKRYYCQCIFSQIQKIPFSEYMGILHNFYLLVYACQCKIWYNILVHAHRHYHSNNTFYFCTMFLGESGNHLSHSFIKFTFVSYWTELTWLVLI